MRPVARLIGDPSPAGAALLASVEGFFAYAEDLGLSPEDLLPRTFADPDARIELDPTALGRARAIGGPDGYGLRRLEFGPAFASDARVVWHELAGHGPTRDAFGVKELSFAHSFGDAAAAIRFDPEPAAANGPGPDRFATFPAFVHTIPELARRHDRAPPAWAWGGPRDNNAYDQEELLSSSLFRLYRAIGGDSRFVARRRLAARRVLRPLLTCLHHLGPAQWRLGLAGFLAAFDAADRVESPRSPPLHAPLLESFRALGWNSGRRDHANREPGRLPAQDVWVEDGRHGAFLPASDLWWTSPHVVNRTRDDGGTAHQRPMPNVPNFLSITVSNRGWTPARGVAVRLWQPRRGLGVRWPNDFVLAGVAAAPEVPPSASLLLAPVRWTPLTGSNGVVAVEVASSGDPSLLSLASHAEWDAPALYECDNNVVLHALSPVAARARDALRVTLANLAPSPRSFVITADLPGEMARRGWSVAPEPPSLTLPAEGSADVTIRVTSGASLSDLSAIDRRIHVIQASADAEPLPLAGLSWEIRE